MMMETSLQVWETCGFHDDINYLTSLGNLGCFQTASQAKGTRGFHVAVQLEPPTETPQV